MKIRVGTRLLSFDEETALWLKTEIINIDSEGFVRLRNDNGVVWETDTDELKDTTCFKDLK